MMGCQPVYHYCQLEHNTQKRDEIPVPRTCRDRRLCDHQDVFDVYEYTYI